jgi:hypothetical protein
MALTVDDLPVPLVAVEQHIGRRRPESRIFCVFFHHPSFLQVNGQHVQRHGIGVQNGPSPFLSATKAWCRAKSKTQRRFPKAFGDRLRPKIVITYRHHIGKSRRIQYAGAPFRG